MKKMLMPVLVSILILSSSNLYAEVCEASGDGRCYYISQLTGDDDTGDGSFESPWKSFKNVVSYYGDTWLGSTLKPPTWVNIAPGDYIYVMDGEYTDVYNYAGSTTVATFRTRYGTEQSQFYLKAYPGHHPVINPQLQGRGFHIYQGSWWNVEGFEIVNAFQAGLDVSAIDHMAVTGMHIHDTDGIDNDNIAGLRGTASNFEVSYSTFHDNYDRTCADTGGISTQNSANMVFFSGANVSVHDNLFYQSPSLTASFSGGGLKYKHAQTDPQGYFRVYNNVFRQCKHFSIGTGTQNSHIHNNIVYDGSGIISQDWGGPTHQTNQLFEYNTLYNEGNSPFLIQPTDEWANDDFSDPENITFRKNIIYELRSTGSNERGTVVIGTYKSDALYAKTTGQLHFNDNCYYNPLTPVQFNLFSANGGTYGVLGAQYSFAAWQALGYDSGSLNEDPRFVDIASRNFALTPDSPCSDQGAYASPPVNPAAPTGLQVE